MQLRYSVVVSTPDSESGNPGSNPGTAMFRSPFTFDPATNVMAQAVASNDSSRAGVYKQIDIFAPKTRRSMHCLVVGISATWFRSHAIGMFNRSLSAECRSRSAFRNVLETHLLDVLLEIGA